MFKQALDNKGVRLDIARGLCKYVKEKEVELRIENYEFKVYSSSLYRRSYEKAS
jgi:hypothetical protein